MKGSTEEFPVVPMVRDAGPRATGGGTPETRRPIAAREIPKG